MKRIPLYNGKGFTEVDKEDFDHLNQFTWSLATVGYAVRHDDGNTVYMHREIMELGFGDKRLVDHRNGDPLDNKRSNLRVCSKSQNQANQRAKKKLDGSSQSRYKGVSRRYSKSSKPWRCRIAFNGKSTTRYFATEIEAAKEYNKLAIEVHGEYAYVNKFEDGNDDNVS